MIMLRNNNAMDTIWVWILLVHIRVTVRHEVWNCFDAESIGMWYIHPIVELHGIKGTNRVKEVIMQPWIKKN
jgi:hypothetical protein